MFGLNPNPVISKVKPAEKDKAATSALTPEQVTQLLETNKTLQEQLAGQTKLLAQQQQAMTAIQQQLAVKDTSGQKAATQFEAPKVLTEEEYDELTPQQLEARTNQMMQHMFEKFAMQTQADLQQIQQRTTQQYGNSEYKRLTATYPDFAEWQGEMEKAINDKLFGDGITPDKMYELVKAMHPEKAKKLAEKYPEAGTTSNANFGLGGLPASDQDAGQFVISAPGPEDDPDAHLEKTLDRYMEATGKSLDGILSSGSLPGVERE